MKLNITAAAILLVVGSKLLAAEPQTPPAAKSVPFTETLHGVQVSDPYRWMEAGGPEFVKWLEAQESYANSFLTALPEREKLIKGIEARSGATASMGGLQAKGATLFVSRRVIGAERTSLYVRPLSGGAERLLFDPSKLDTESAKGFAIDYWEASPDGRHVYVGVSPGGSELSTLRVIDVASGSLLPEAIPLALFNYSIETPGGLYPQWLPDGSGFFYSRLADGAKPGTAEFFLNSQLLLHRLGTDPKTDVLIMHAGLDPRVPLPPIGVPSVVTQPGSRHAVLAVAFGVQRAMELRVAPLDQAVTGKADWLPVVEPRDDVEGFALLGDNLYLLRRDRPRGRVLRMSAAAPSLANATEVVPEGETVIERIISARDGVYLIERAATGTRIRRLGNDGTIVTAKLPIDGTSYQLFGTPQSDGVYVSLENAVTPRGRYLVRGAKTIDTGLAPKPPFSTSNYVSEVVLVTARDGKKVPLNIVRRRDTPRDGKRPVLLDAYGAYGASSDPSFVSQVFAFLDQGAIYATAHVRGGGEFGNEWWKAGYQETKPNTWRDAIDCAESLISAGWTSAGRITIWGASAGGIMAGRAVTERPDLWAAGVANVGAMNALRFEFTPNGETNVPEFGTVKTVEGFRALAAMDAYHSIKAGTSYPPMLLTAGMNDQRVAVWQPAKFVARMQAATTGGPVLFKVQTDQGHGLGSGRSQIDNASADIGAFALWAAKQPRR